MYLTQLVYYQYMYIYLFIYLITPIIYFYYFVAFAWNAKGFAIACFAFLVLFLGSVFCLFHPLLL